MTTVDIADEGGAIVISITTASRYRRRGDDCKHERVTIDAQYSEIVCDACQRRLNPIEWLAKLADRWKELQRLYRSVKNEQAQLAMKRRAKCTGCGSFITLRPSDDDCKRYEASEAARYRAALEDVATLRAGDINEYPGGTPLVEILRHVVDTTARKARAVLADHDVAARGGAK